MRLVAIFILSIVTASVFAVDRASAQKSLQISETTKHYSISGNSPAELAKQMSRKGPFSFQHRRRAWATAARNLSYQLVWRQVKGLCQVKQARVKMNITYTLPKLARQPSRSSTRKAWKAMYNLLNRHEKTHGKFYKEFAQKAYRGLRRLPAASTCRQVERAARQLVDRLSNEDNARNDRFDNRDQRNYRRMALLTRRG